MLKNIYTYKNVQRREVTPFHILDPFNSTESHPKIEKVVEIIGRVVKSRKVSLVSDASTSLAIEEVMEQLIRQILHPVDCIIHSNMLILGRSWSLPLIWNVIGDKFFHTRFRFFFDQQIMLKSRTVISHYKTNSLWGKVASKVWSTLENISNVVYVLRTRRKNVGYLWKRIDRYLIEIPLPHRLCNVGMQLSSTDALSMCTKKECFQSSCEFEANLLIVAIFILGAKLHIREFLIAIGCNKASR